MVAVQRTTDALFIRMRQIVETDQIQTVRTTARLYLQERGVSALVFDIRGCKPIDADCCAMLSELFTEARRRGVDRFVRVGEGTLCAVQVNALEVEADISDMTMVVNSDSALAHLGLSS